ncbi:PepSY domain-containing protein [Vagococcus carniphilus]|uniref:PepSY domain-containing protein n=1 Tax=Vagococcus carniphilus TaxID=218144 RepID=UPI00288C8EC6|nr:PepSY domain-containing protein [Vagococcus carniphilus]MDT2839963.1 PepSY domain-containing protein [Vagococcus carniphilus]
MKKTLLAGITFVLLGVMVGCGNKTVQQPTSESKNETTDSQVSEKTKVEKVKTVDVSDAIKIYQEKHPKTDITSVELESERSGLVYKIEGVDDETEYDLTINASSKEILRDKSEKLDKEDRAGVKRKQEKLDLKDIISIDEATTIAEKENGFGTAQEWSLDKDLSTTYWEVKGVEGRKEAQIKIDAKSGEVLEFELDD